MAADSKKQDPEIEEILASIRRIISGEDGEAPTASPVAEKAAKPIKGKKPGVAKKPANKKPVAKKPAKKKVVTKKSPAKKATPKPAAGKSTTPKRRRAPEDNILVLTELAPLQEQEQPLVLDEVAAEDVRPKVKPEDKPEAKPLEDPAPMIEVPPVAEETPEPETAPEPVPEPEPEAIPEAPLPDPGIAANEEIDLALEDLIRAMLREMLKEYLDKNLADIVKKIAAEEIAKSQKKS